MLGDLAVGEPVEVLEANHFLLVGRQSIDRLTNRPHVVDGVGGRRQGDERSVTDGDVVDVGGGTTRFAPVDVDGDATGDGGEPRPERAAAFVSSPRRADAWTKACWVASSANSR